MSITRKTLIKVGRQNGRSMHFVREYMKAVNDLTEISLMVDGKNNCIETLEKLYRYKMDRVCRNIRKDYYVPGQIMKTNNIRSRHIICNNLIKQSMV